MDDYEANRQKIAQQEQTHREQVAGLLAGVTSIVTPLIVAFLIAQRRFIEGITLSGMK